MKLIPYGRQFIDESDEEAVLSVLRSDFLTQGPAVERFEKAVAQYCGAKYAVAVSSATSALHIGCLAARLGPGSELWTSPNTFVASANCALYCGAQVDFVDIDRKTYNLSVESLRSKLVERAKSGNLPKVLVPVHFAGQSCEMLSIFSLAKEYGVTVLEDASHAIGGRYKGRPVGSCEFSDMTIFSFHPVKVMTSGEGGVVTTNSPVFYESLSRLRNHGITRDPKQMASRSEETEAWYYEQVDLGFNYRMTDIHAALGTSQLAKVDGFVKTRHDLAQRYDRLLKELPLILPERISDSYTAFHLYVVQVDPNRTRVSRKEAFEKLRLANIGVNVHYIPVHTQPYYRGLGFNWGQFPVAESYYQHAITLPLFPTLTAGDQDRVVSTLREIFL